MILDPYLQGLLGVWNMETLRKNPDVSYYLLNADEKDAFHPILAMIQMVAGFDIEDLGR